MENTPKKQDFSDKTKANVLVVFFLIFFFPLGLFFMWTKVGWHKYLKWGITGMFGLFIIAAIAGGGDENKSTNTTTQTTTQKAAEPTKAPEPTKETTHELDFDVRFNALAFQITNNEEKAWDFCNLEINSGIIKGGWKYENQGFSAKEVVILPFNEFTKGDGERFNSFDTKPKKLTISCEDTNKKRGFNYFEISN